MAYEVDGKVIETNEAGYLLDPADWNEKVAEAIAAGEGIELTGKHWDIINYMRETAGDNPELIPNTRALVKAMSEKWGEKIKQNDLYVLFPRDPSKQGGKIAGLPESRRKGGY
jgi:tRNA 2-thiouridine synthesizing protein E